MCPSAILSPGLTRQCEMTAPNLHLSTFNWDPGRREMQKAGWIELEVNEDWVELEVNEEKKLHRGRPQSMRATAARCTDQGREALRLLGE